MKTRAVTGFLSEAVFRKKADGFQKSDGAAKTAGLCKSSSDPAATLSDSPSPKSRITAGARRASSPTSKRPLFSPRSHHLDLSPTCADAQ
jgi:hypothetical protein